MTEEEARTKWCPFATRPMVLAERMGVPYVAVAASRTRSNGGAEPGARCLASDCMMWRWEHPDDGIFETGYCGFAGRAP